jgi:hypothetical protein
MWDPQISQLYKPARLVMGRDSLFYLLINLILLIEDKLKNSEHDALSILPLFHPHSKFQIPYAEPYFLAIY